MLVYILNRAAGDKILCLSIDSEKMSPEDFQAILKSAAAHPVRLDVKRPSDVNVPRVDVDVQPPANKLDVGGVAKVGDADLTNIDGHAPWVSLNNVDVHQLAADGGVPSTRMGLPDGGAATSSSSSSVDGGVDLGGSAQVNADIGNGLMAELDKMFEVNREDVNIDSMHKPSLDVDGSQLDGEMKMPSVEAELDVNLGPPTLNGIPDTDEDVVIRAKAPRVESKPVDFTTPDVEIGTARIEDFKVGGDVDINADKDLDVGGGEVSVNLSDLPPPDQNIELRGFHGSDVDRNLSTDIKYKGLVIEGGNVGGGPTVESSGDLKETDVGLNFPTIIEQETDVTVQHQVPTVDVSVAAAAAPDIDMSTKPSSPIGYVKVVSPITATDLKTLDENTPAEVTVKDKKPKKAKKKPFGAKVKNLFKNDQGKVHTTEVKKKKKFDDSVEHPGMEITCESPDTEVGANVDINLPAANQASIATETHDMDVGIDPTVKTQADVDLPSATMSNETGWLGPGIEMDIDAGFGTDVNAQAPINATVSDVSPTPQALATELQMDASSPEVDVPSLSDDGIHVALQPAEVNVDGKLEVENSKDVGNIESPSVNVSVDIPEINADHGKAVAVVDLAKDGKKKSKFRFPFKSKSKKAKVEAPSVSVEMPNPTEVNDVNKNADVDLQLSGDLSTPAPDSDIAVNLVGTTADVEIPEVHSSLPDTKAEASVDANLPVLSPDLQVTVSSSSSSSSSSRSSSELKLDASAPEVDVPSVGVDGKTPDLAGVEVGIQRPEVDVDGKLDVETSKDVDSIESPTVSATVDIPQIIADHDKAVAAVDLAVSPKDGKKKSKFHFPFKSKSKKTPDVEVKVKAPIVSAERSNPLEMNDVHKNRNVSGDVDPQLAVDISTPTLDADSTVNVDGGKAGAEIPEVLSSLPETRAQASVNADLPVPDAAVDTSDVKLEYDSKFPHANLDATPEFNIQADGEPENSVIVELPKTEMDIGISEINIAPDIAGTSGGLGTDLLASVNGDVPDVSLENTIDVEGEVPTGKVSIEKSQEAFKAENPVAVKGSADLTAVDTDTVQLPDAELRHKLDVKGVVPAARISVEKCEESEQPPVAIDGNTNVSMQPASVEIKPSSPDAHVKDKKKSGRGLLGGIFGKKDKKKEKKVDAPIAEMKLEVHADDGQVALDLPDISENIHTNMRQEGILLSPTGDNEQPTMEFNIPSPDVEIKTTDVPTAGLNVSSNYVGEVDIEVPEVQKKSQSTVHAEMPELSNKQDIDINANKILQKDVDITLGGVGGPLSSGMAVDTTIASAQLEVGKPEISAPTGIDLDADITALPQADTVQVAVDPQSGNLASNVDVHKAEIQVNLPSGTIDVDQPQLTPDSNVDIPATSTEHRVHFSDHDTCIQLPSEIPHGKAAADVDVAVPAKNGKKKSKFRFPFKSKSKKAPAVEAKVEAPTVSAKIPNPTEVNDVNKNADVNLQLSGDLSTLTPDADTTVDLDGAKADVEIPEVHSSLSDTKAEASVDANSPVVLPDLQITVSSSSSSSSSSRSSSELKLDASAPEIDVPSVGIDGKTSDLTGVDVKIQRPEVDVDGKLDVETSKEVDNVGSPTVSATVDIPQINADHDKAVADVDLAVPATDGKKKSKFHFPFKSKSKKAPAVDAKVKAPIVSVEIPNHTEVSDVSKNADVDLQISGDLSAPSLNADSTVNMDGPRADVVIPEVPSSLPETKAEASVDANLPVVSPDLQVTASPSSSSSSSSSSSRSSSEVKLDASAPDVEVPSVDVDGKTPDLAGIEVGIQRPEVDVDGKLDAETSKDLDNIQSPSVSATVDIPQINADHGKAVAGDDLPKDGKKKSKFHFPFKSKSKKTPAVEAKVEAPNVRAEIPNAMPIAVAVDVDSADRHTPEATELSMATEPVSAEVDLKELQLDVPSPEVDAPSIGDNGVHVGVHPAEINVDSKLDVRTSKDVGSNEAPSISATADIPQLKAEHGKPAADVVVAVPAKDGKKKSKFHFPFKSKSKKAPTVEAKVEVPRVNAEIPNPAEVNDVNKNADVDLQLSGDVSAPTLDVDTTVNLDGTSADMEIPEVPSSLPETKAEASVDANLPVLSPDLQITVSSSSSSSSRSSSELKLDASAPEVDVPLVGVDGKTPDLAGVEVGIQRPEVDADVKLDAETSKEVDNVGSPSVSATVDIPQTNADHDKAVVNADPGVSPSSKKKKSKFRFPFKSKNKNARAVEVKVETPSVKAERSSTADRNDVHKDSNVSGDVDPQLDVPASVHLSTEPDSTAPETSVEVTAPRLSSFPHTTDAGLVDGSWPDSTPTLHTDRRVQRSESFQRHGYAILVTSAMLKLEAAVHDDLQNGVPQTSDDQVDDAKSSGSSSSSSSRSSSRQSGQYYHGINSTEFIQHQAEAGDGHCDKDSTEITEAEHSLTNGMRLQQLPQDDTSREIGITVGVRRSTTDNSAANGASEA